MNRRPTLATQLAIFRIALRQRQQNLLVLTTRVGLFALILFVFTQLWGVLLGQNESGSGVREHVWYLAITEWVTISQPRVHLDIETDVRSGELAYHLTRPVSYLSFRICEALAELVLSMAVIGGFGFLWTFWLAGGLPHEPWGLVCALPLGLLASLVMLLFNVVIGLSAFWLLDCSPIYWVWQKATFVLGGLMVPLALYPAWLRAVAQRTPFAALLSGPGNLAFGLDPGSALTTTVRLCGWMAISVALVRLVYHRGVARVELHGG
jgi:ABC-2 type transport system permease protein